MTTIYKDAGRVQKVEEIGGGSSYDETADATKSLNVDASGTAISGANPLPVSTVTNAADTARTTGTLVQPVQHIGADGKASPSGKGIALVLTGPAAATLTNDTQMPDMQIVSRTGAGDVYFYLPVNTTNVVELVDVYFQVVPTAATTISVFLEVLAQGAANWQPVTPYTTGAYSSEEAIKMNVAYPLREFLGINNQYRLKATVGATTTVGMKAMGMIL